MGWAQKKTSGVLLAATYLSYQAGNLHNSNDQRPKPEWELAASMNTSCTGIQCGSPLGRTPEDTKEPWGSQEGSNSPSQALKNYLQHLRQPRQKPFYQIAFICHSLSPFVCPWTDSYARKRKAPANC